MICGIALVLLLDASASIHHPEWRLQVEATADAVATEPAVRRAAENGGLAVAAIGFTEDAAPMVGWTVLRAANDAQAFAAALRAAPRPKGSYTNIAGALDASVAAFASAPCAADRLVVDLSTDGVANPWFPDTAEARDRAAAAGATVNAIGVGGNEGSVPGWLRDNAATAGGFVVESADWAAFARGIKNKIGMELAAR